MNRSNAATAVPWAIIGAISISGILGTGERSVKLLSQAREESEKRICISAMNIAIAFCMGTDIESILSSDIGQPLAAVSPLRQLEFTRFRLLTN